MAKRGNKNISNNDIRIGSGENGVAIVPNDSGEFDGTNTISAENDSGAKPSDAGNDTVFVDPTSATATGDSGTGTGTGTGKRRGRRPGTKNKPRGTGTTQTTADLSGMLFTIHIVMAKMLKTELLQITKDESEELSAAITRVTQLYDVHLLDEKSWAFLNLALVMGNVYGTRLMVASMKGKHEKHNIVDMPFPIGQASGTN